MMSYSLQVAGRSRVVVGRTVEELSRLLPQGRVIVLTDRNVARCRPELFEGCDPICMEPGEEHKTLQTVEEVCRELIRRGADRTTFLLGVGGGIVTDVTGFVASVYMRGVPFGFVSTTLLGCVDASVGGKNGVNYEGYKNMVGTFNQPDFVLCDPAMLDTLPEREFRAGLAEIVTAGLIADRELFGLFESHSLEEFRRDRALLGEAVMRAVKVKAHIVERDERESDERRKLNLGHTFAHAIEKCSRDFLHGEAVAIGTVMIARLSERLGTDRELPPVRLPGGRGCPRAERIRTDGAARRDRHRTAPPDRRAEARQEKRGPLGRLRADARHRRLRDTPDDVRRDRPDGGFAEVARRQPSTLRSPPLVQTPKSCVFPPEKPCASVSGIQRATIRPHRHTARNASSGPSRRPGQGSRSTTP